MRIPAALPIALLVALAGCLGGDGGSRPPGPTATPHTPTPSPSPTTTAPVPARIPLLLDFHFNGCSGATVMQMAPLADVQALLPAPFTAAPFSPLADVPTDRGVLAVDLFVCANLTTPNTEVPRTFYGQAYTFVERPVEAVPDAPEGAAQEYVFRVLAAQDVLAVLWPAAGYDTRNGSADLQFLGSPTPLRLAQGRIGDYGMDAAASSNPASPVSVVTPFARYTRLGDGSLLHWTGTYDFPTAFLGSGDFTVADDDAFAPFRSPAGNLGGVALVYDTGAMRDNDLVKIRAP